MIEILYFALAALAAHLTVSCGQTLLHQWVGHHRIGGLLYRNHIKFHHRRYSVGRLATPAHEADYDGKDGNNTPFFLIPIALLTAVLYFVLPMGLLIAVLLSTLASFYLHVVFDRAYQVENCWLSRFGWFRRKQQLHFMHHLHANTNFAVVDFFWDRAFGTFRKAGKIVH